jgi:type II secretory pathway pseudopilin PulG
MSFLRQKSVGVPVCEAYSKQRNTVHPALRVYPSQTGFCYAMVLAAVVIVGIVVEAARVTTWRVLQADREAELLFRGRAYQKAIESFYQAGGAFPRTLEDLLKDPRSPSKRHIRALYSDPVAEGELREWSLVRSSDGSIAGVASTSKKEPLKQANFPAALEKFSGAKSYSEWVFEYVPPPRPPAPRPPGTKPPGASPPVLRTF